MEVPLTKPSKCYRPFHRNIKNFQRQIMRKGKHVQSVGKEVFLCNACRLLILGNDHEVFAVEGDVATLRAADARDYTSVDRLLASIGCNTESLTSSAGNGKRHLESLNHYQLRWLLIDFIVTGISEAKTRELEIKGEQGFCVLLLYVRT